MDQQKSRRGGAVKKAPPGYYTAKQAMERIGFNESTFHYHVRTGKIKRHVFPPRVEGVYLQREIDAFADKMTLIYLQALTEDELDPIEFRRAQFSDAQGIVNVLSSRGWPTTSAELRQSWYEVNPSIDHVVTQNGIIVGYVNIVPYVSEVLAAMMAGRKRGWDIKPSDIFPYIPGNTYDVFAGLAEHQEAPDPARIGRSLILGVFGTDGVLQQWARQGILIRYMYGTSAEKEGIRVARLLGFEQQEPQPGDLFRRFVLDFEKSDTHFARQYREAVEKVEEK